MDHNGHYNLNPLGFYLSVVALLTIIAVLANGFIITVNTCDWLKGRILSLVDNILVGISLCNAIWSFCFGNYIFFAFLWPQSFFVGYTFSITFAVMLFLAFSSSWLTAWLCLYFFVKIIPFKSFYLVKLKLTIDVVVPWLILFSEFMTFFNSLYVIFFTRPSSYNSTLCNQTGSIIFMQFNKLYYIFVLGFSGNSALFIILVSTICIVWSLCKHTYQMKKTICNEESSRIRTHRSSAKTVASLLLIYIVFYVTYVLMTTLYFTDNLSIYYWITVWTMLSTSIAMSLVFILGNSKLCQAFYGMLHRSSP